MLHDKLAVTIVERDAFIGTIELGDDRLQDLMQGLVDLNVVHHQVLDMTIQQTSQTEWVIQGDSETIHLEAVGSLSPVRNVAEKPVIDAPKLRSIWKRLTGRD